MVNLKLSSQVFSRNNLIIFALGLAAAMPLVLIMSSLSAWFFELSISKTTIGLFSLALIPYNLKFLWSPFLDGLKIPILYQILGRRLSWLFVFQLFLAVMLFILAQNDHANNLFVTAIIVLLIAFFSASQDILIDAYRIELGKEEEQGMLTASYVYGYRVGMLISGAGALVLAEFYSFTFAYILAAFLFVIFAGLNFLLPKEQEEKYLSSLGAREWINKYLFMPFRDFFLKKGAFFILIFVVLFKLGDAFVAVMTNPFLLSLGFSKLEIAEIVKSFGLLATLIGSYWGGVLVFKYDMKYNLLLAGILQMLTNFVFLVQLHYGHNQIALYFTMGIENLAGGMGTVVFTAYISSLCNKSFSATQFALFTSLAAVGRNILSSGSGYVADFYGWHEFFIISVLLAIPALIMLKFINFNK